MLRLLAEGRREPVNYMEALFFLSRFLNPYLCTQEALPAGQIPTAPQYKWYSRS